MSRNKKSERYTDQLLPIAIGSPDGLSSVASTLTRNSSAVAANVSEVPGPSYSNVSCEELCEEIDKLTLEDINGVMVVTVILKARKYKFTISLATQKQISMLKTVLTAMMREVLRQN